jgi:hypothetical protein
VASASLHDCGRERILGVRDPAFAAIHLTIERGQQ